MPDSETPRVDEATLPQEGDQLSGQVSMDSLRTLLAFTEAGGVTAAARRLGVSQPVVSRKLDALTRGDACGTILLVRDESGLRLSEAGTASLPTIRELVRKYDQLQSYWSGGESSATTVSLAVGHFAAEHIVPSALAALRVALPDCEVRTQVLRGAERILGVFDGRFDLALVSHDSTQIAAILAKERGSRTGLQVEELADLPLFVVAKKGTAEAAELAAIEPHKVVPLRKLLTWELVGLDPTSGIRRQIEYRLRDLRISGALTFVAEGGGWSAAREFARHALGVAILPFPVLRPGDDRIFTIRRLSDDVRLARYAIFRDGLSVVGERVLTALRDTAQQPIKVALK